MPATTRIAYEDLPEDLRELLRPRVERLGYLGEFFQVAAHQPEALAAFVQYTEALKHALPDRLVESIALTIASESGNAYEQVQHERLALKLGFAEDEVAALVTPGAALDGFSAAERAAIDLARQVLAARGRACPAYDDLERLEGEQVAVGCLMTAVRYLAHATMANTWDLSAPVESPLAREASNV
jgi:alkylhydroperoxidase family enzyme